MQATEGKIGRVFILRLEDGDTIPGCIEEFALKNGVRNGYVNFTAGIKTGNIQSSFNQNTEKQAASLNITLSEPHEGTAQGFISRNTQDKPILHIHGTCGRDGQTVSGCLTNSAEINVYGEVIVYEILDAVCSRITDKTTGMQLLKVGTTTEQEEQQHPATTTISGQSSTINLNDGYSHIIHLFNSTLN